MNEQLRKKIGVVLGVVMVSVVVVGGYYATLKLFAQPRSEQPDAQPHPIPVPITDELTKPLIIDPHFQIGIFAKELGQPRVIIEDPQETLIVSITKAGEVVALPDRDKNGVTDETVTLLSNRTNPHGLALTCHATALCDLYVAETAALYRYTYDPGTLTVSNEKKLLDFPPGGRHFTRTLLFRDPPSNNELLISIGSTCDVCHEFNPRHATIEVYNTLTGKSRTFATGLRNSVFLALHPLTSAIWATEMGRDNLGDNLPPDEINIITDNANYGWPTCFGNNMHDAKFDTALYVRNPCMLPFETPAYIDIPAHSAPLGLTFLNNPQWPRDMRDDLLVAFHGSWNRSEPTGYKVVWYELDDSGRLINHHDAITGWLDENNKAWGRPAGIYQGTNGTVYISDDLSGTIYSLRFNEEYIEPPS